MDDSELIDENAFDPESIDDKEKGVKAIKSRLKNGLPKNFKKIAISCAVILVSAVFILTLMPSSNDEAVVTAARPTPADMPVESPTTAPLLEGNTLENDTINKSIDNAFNAASESGTSLISGFSFYEDVKNKEDNDPTRGEDSISRDKAISLMAMSQTAASHDANPDNITDNRNGVSSEQMRNPFNLLELVNDAAIDTSSWDDQIKQMSAAASDNTWSRSSSAYDPPASQIAPQQQPIETSVNAQAVHSGGSGPEETVFKHRLVPSQIEWVQLISSCNTDEPDFIAEIVSGPNARSKLLGKCSLTPLKRIYAQLSTLITPDKQVVVIDGVLLSANEFRQSLSGRIDNHYFSRYMPFILANFAGAYAESLVSQTTVDDSNGGSVTQVNAIPKASDQLKYAGGRTLQSLLPGFAKSLSRPPTGYLKQHSVYPMMYRKEAIIK